MAQNSDALQEAGMDELLASIREIIEENSAAAPQSARAGGGDSFSKETGGGRAHAQNAVMPDFRQDIRVHGDSAAGGQNGFASAQGRGSDASVYKNGREGNIPAVNRSNGFGGLPGAGGAHISPARGDVSVPVQDSMNALAERIGLNQGNSGAESGLRAAFNDKSGRSQAEREVAPPFIAAHGGRSSGNGGSPAFASPPSMNNGSMANGSPDIESRRHAGNMPARARFNPPAIEPNFRDAGYPMRERLYSADINSGAVPVSSRMEAERGGGGRSGGVRLAERRSEGFGLDKNYSADVEHSTESLLRPLIAQWLDEHFQGLFEKILREEVQRFIHSMRGDKGRF